MLIFFDYCAILENSSTATLNKGTMLLRICKEKKKKTLRKKYGKSEKNN